MIHVSNKLDNLSNETAKISTRHMSTILMLFLCIILMLTNTDIVISGAHNGLILWYSSVLPSILPFMIVTSLLLKYCSGSGICGLGLLCGLPVGANLVNRQFKNHTISKQTANLLLSVCNLASPMFILGYIWNRQLHKEYPLIPFLLSIYIPGILYAFISYISRYNKNNIKRTNNTNSSDRNHRQITVKNYPTEPPDTEATLKQCLSVMLLIGLYIMLFCIITQFCLKKIPVSGDSSVSLLSKIAISGLEITNGIQIITGLSCSMQMKTALIAGLTSFGGICSIFQTKSVITESELSIKKYTIIKIIWGILSFLISYTTYGLFSK